MNEKYRLQPGLSELADMEREQALNYECESSCKANSCTFREQLVFTSNGLVDICIRKLWEEKTR